MKIVDASQYHFMPMDNILIDTNFWLLTYNIFASRNDRHYSGLLDYISSSNIYITDLIISEFIHTSLKIAFKNYKKSNNLPDIAYKEDYQSTDDFKQQYQIAVETMHNEILGLPKINLIETKKEYLYKAFEFPNKMLDFNDRVIVQTALDNQLSILTDDADYKDCNADIKILTKNKNLLKY
ncbi:hypothetical protein HQ33_07415 [Limosilactobacillus reuteri]|nr:hypothetical protein HQ33_07415 [Limosilactobacillus reuteri]